MHLRGHRWDVTMQQCREERCSMEVLQTRLNTTEQRHTFRSTLYRRAARYVSIITILHATKYQHNTYLWTQTGSVKTTASLVWWLRRPPGERKTCLRFPLSPWFLFQVESCHRLQTWYSRGCPARRLAL